MGNEREKAVEYLRSQKMYFGDIDMNEYTGIFLKEMNKGLAGEESSLLMIPTYIEAECKVPEDKKVIVLDAGGTNFRSAVVHFNNKMEEIIEDFNKYPMPGTKKEISKDDFFLCIYDYLEDLVKESESIGFCFSYPTEIYPNKDGKPVKFSKEVKAKEIEGVLIGENLNAVFKKKGLDEKKVIILNDTVATLLGGVIGVKKRIFDGFIGFILGTGTNICYSESNGEIKKIDNVDKNKSQIVTLESGGFAGIPQGLIDKEFDKTNKDPGFYSFEKMISGKYLGSLCYHTLRMASADSLFSKSVSDNLKTINDLSTIDANNFMLYPYDTSNVIAKIFHANENDTNTAYYLLNSIIERAAKITAISLAATVIKSEKGKDKTKPVCITAEGTTFYHLKSLKFMTEYYLKSFLENEKGRYTEIIHVENATLVGAAVAGLTN